MSKKSFQPSKLVAAIRAGRLSGVILAIEDGGDVEEADIHGVSGLPLRVACFEGEMAIVRELLRCGANVNAMAADGPGAPLRLALRGGNGEIAALLLQNGAEIPPGLEIDPAVLSRVGKLSPLPGEAAVPMLPEAPSSKPAEINQTMPEQMIEEVDLQACYGTDTNLLAMDLLRFDEEANAAAAPAPQKDSASDTKKQGFWKSGRSS